jgi:hypothetical protein
MDPRRSGPPPRPGPRSTGNPWDRRPPPRPAGAPRTTHARIEGLRGARFCRYAVTMVPASGAAPGGQMYYSKVQKGGHSVPAGGGAGTWVGRISLISGGAEGWDANRLGLAIGE